MKWSLRSQSGYVLVELLVTVVILTGGILFLVDSVRESFDVSRRTLQTQAAVSVAHEAFDQLMTMPHGSGVLESGEKVIDDITYRWAFVKQQLVPIDQYSSQVFVVNLKVKWTKGRDYQVELPFLWNVEEGQYPTQDSL